MPFVINQIVEVLKIAISKINEFQTLLQSKGLITVIKDHVRMPAALRDFILQSLQQEGLITTLQQKLQENITQIITTATSYVTNL